MQKVWGDLYRINLDFALETRLARLVFTDPSYLERIMEGLEKADLLD